MTHTTDFLSKLKPTEPVRQVTAAEIQRKWDLISQAMASCGAKGTMIQAVPGPRVTRFELEISKADAKKLCKQLGQSVSNNSLLARWISENILSLEIPNDVPQTISAYELFHSDQWQNTQMTLPIMLGMGDNYAPVMIDLATAPHLLMAGCTGTGKSVCMQMALASLMLKYSSDDLKFLIFDIKAVEFTRMTGSPYLLSPVITAIDQAAEELESLEKEMKRRFQLRQRPKSEILQNTTRKATDRCRTLLPSWMSLLTSCALKNTRLSSGLSTGLHRAVDVWAYTLFFPLSDLMSGCFH